MQKIKKSHIQLPTVILHTMTLTNASVTKQFNALVTLAMYHTLSSISTTGYVRHKDPNLCPKRAYHTSPSSYILLRAMTHTHTATGAMTTSGKRLYMHSIHFISFICVTWYM